MYIYFNISSELLDERLYYMHGRYIFKNHFLSGLMTHAFFFIQLSWFMINLPCLYVVNICHNFIVVVMKRGKEGTEQYYGYNC